MDSLTKAKMKYAKKSVLRKYIDFYINTEPELIAWATRPNFAGRVKDLIRKDMEKNEIN